MQWESQSKRKEETFLAEIRSNDIIVLSPDGASVKVISSSKVQNIQIWQTHQTPYFNQKIFPYREQLEKEPERERREREEEKEKGKTNSFSVRVL